MKCTPYSQLLAFGSRSIAQLLPTSRESSVTLNSGKTSDSRGYKHGGCGKALDFVVTFACSALTFRGLREVMFGESTSCDCDWVRSCGGAVGQYGGGGSK